MRLSVLSAAGLLLFAAALQGADLRLEVNPEWAGQPIGVPSPVRSTRAEQQVRITRLSALLSGFALRRPDGSAVYLGNQYGFIDAGSGRTGVTLTGVDKGKYSGLEFTIGLPHDVDSQDASRWPAGHPLNPITDGMYWGWQGGYVFAAIEGNWWTGSGPHRGFSFHLASGAGVMRVHVDVPFEVQGPILVRCAWDLAAMIRPLQFEADGKGSSTHSRADDPLAHWLADSAVRAVGWRGWEPNASTVTDLADSSAVRPVPAGAVPLVVPAGFPQPSLPADNPLTRAGIDLGKALFSDPRLSGNGTQSCISCHKPAHGFADPAAVSIGAEGTSGFRHSPSLLNLAWAPAFDWDGSQPLIRNQVLNAMTGSQEMNGDTRKIAAKLAQDRAVAERFRVAFGSPGVTPERISLAIEQYLLTLVSADSKFDRAARGEESLTATEQRGLELFLTEYDPAHGRHGADCFHCHGGALFGDYVYRDNGLKASPDDRGRGAVSGQTYDDGKFKTPSLRNVAVRGPYMHDGSLADLKAVVAHYMRGVQRTPNLDPNLGKHPDSGLDLSEADQAALVAFLLTLTSAK